MAPDNQFKFVDRGDGVPFAPVNEDGIQFAPVPRPAHESPFPQIEDPGMPPMAGSNNQDAASAFAGLGRGGYEVFTKAMGILGIPFEKLENIAATALQPVAKIGGTAIGNALERGAGYAPDASVAQVARESLGQVPGNLLELGKALTFQESEPQTMATVARDYAQGVTTHEPSPAYQVGTGLAAGFLVDPFLVSAGLKGATALGKAAGIPQKLEALNPTVWKLAKLEQRAGKAERIDRAAELGQSTRGPAVQQIAADLSERAGTPIGPRAVEQRIAQVMRGSVTQDERIAAISNPLIREFEANANELQSLGILSKNVYTRQLTAAEVSGLNSKKAQIEKSLTRLQTAPHYVGTPEISAKFPGRSDQIAKLQGQLSDINKRLYTSEVYGGTGYFPRMYRTKEEAAAARERTGWYKPNRVRAPYAKQREDIPADVRMQMGEIQEAGYPTTKRLIQQAADIENGRLFKLAANNPQLAAKAPQTGFMPDPIPEGKAYGALAGMYVHPKVYHDVMDLTRLRGNVERAYDSFIGAFKTAKVPLSPSTHVRNMGTNVMLNAFGGFGEVEQMKRLPGTIQQMRGNSAEWQYAKRYFRGSTFATGEVLDDLLRTHEAGMGTGFEKAISAGNAAFGKLTSVPSKVYQAEEAVNKFNRYLWRREQGWSQERALLDANKWGIDYGELSAFEKNYMRRVMPFYTFPRKVVPLLAEGLRDNPYAVAKYPMFATLMTKHSLSQLDLSDKDYDQLRRVVPQYMQSGGYILMPYRDGNGDLRLFDWTYNVPWGPLSDLQSRGGLNTLISNPLVQIAGDLQRNKSSWTEREIFNERTDPERVKFAKKVLYAWQSLSPSLLPDFIPGEQYSSGGTNWGKLYDALAGTPRMAGGRLKQQPVPETLAQVFLGARTQPIDVRTGTYGKLADMSQARREISTEMRKVDRWYREGRVNKEQRDSSLRNLQDRLRQYYLRESPVAPKE